VFGHSSWEAARVYDLEADLRYVLNFFFFKMKSYTSPFSISFLD
jgi:hypothetical protein